MSCYTCKHRGNVGGSAHSTCTHPQSLLEGFLIMTDSNHSIMKIKYSKHGKSKGWFNFPLDFDPVWIKECGEMSKRSVTEVTSKI